MSTPIDSAPFGPSPVFPYTATVRDPGDTVPMRVGFVSERAARAWLITCLDDRYASIDVSITRVDAGSGRMRALYRAVDLDSRTIRAELTRLTEIIDTDPSPTTDPVANSRAVGRMLANYVWARAWVEQPACGFAFEAQIRCDNLLSMFIEFHAATDELEELPVLLELIDAETTGVAREIGASAADGWVAVQGDVSARLDRLALSGFFAEVTETDGPTVDSEPWYHTISTVHQVGYAEQARRALHALEIGGVAVIAPLGTGEQIRVGVVGANSWFASASISDRASGELIYLGDLAHADTVGELLEILESGPTITKLGVPGSTYAPIWLSDADVATLTEHEFCLHDARELVRITAERAQLIAVTGMEPMSLSADQFESVVGLDRIAQQIRDHVLQQDQDPFATDPVLENLLDDYVDAFVGALVTGLGPADLAATLRALSFDDSAPIAEAVTSSHVTADEAVDREPPTEADREADVATLQLLTHRYVWAVVELSENSGLPWFAAEREPELAASRQQILSMLQAPHLVDQREAVYEQVRRIVPRDTVTRAHRDLLLEELGGTVPESTDLYEQVAAAAMELVLHASRQGLYAHDHPDETADIGTLCERYTTIYAEAVVDAGVDPTQLAAALLDAEWTAAIAITDHVAPIGSPGVTALFTQAVAPDIPELHQVLLSGHFTDSAAANDWLRTVAGQHIGPYESELHTWATLIDDTGSYTLEGETPAEFIEALPARSDGTHSAEFLASAVEPDAGMVTVAVVDYLDRLEELADQHTPEQSVVGHPDIDEAERELLNRRTVIHTTLREAIACDTVMLFETRAMATVAERHLRDTEWASVHRDELVKAIGEIDVNRETTDLLYDIETACRAIAFETTRAAADASLASTIPGYHRTIDAARQARFSRGHIEAVKRRGFAENVPATIIPDGGYAEDEVTHLLSRGVRVEFADPVDHDRNLVVNLTSRGWSVVDQTRSNTGEFVTTGTSLRYRHVHDLVNELAYGIQSDDGHGSRRWAPVQVPYAVFSHLVYVDDRIAGLSAHAPDLPPVGICWHDPQPVPDDPALYAQYRLDRALDAGESILFADPADSARSIHIVLHHGEWVIYELTNDPTLSGGQRRLGTVFEGAAARAREVIIDLEIGAPYHGEDGPTGHHMEPVVVPETIRAWLHSVDDRIEALVVAARMAAGTDLNSTEVSTEIHFGTIGADYQPYRAQLIEYDDLGRAVSEAIAAFTCERAARAWLASVLVLDAPGTVATTIARVNPRGREDLQILKLGATASEVAHQLDLLHEAVDGRGGDDHINLELLLSDYETAALRLADDRVASQHVNLLIYLDNLRTSISDLIPNSQVGQPDSPVLGRARAAVADAAVSDWTQLSAVRAYAERRAALEAIAVTARDVLSRERGLLLEELSEVEDNARNLGATDTEIDNASRIGIDVGRGGAAPGRRPLIANQSRPALEIFESDGIEGVRSVADRLRMETAHAVDPAHQAEQAHIDALNAPFTIEFGDTRRPATTVVLIRDHGTWMLGHSGRGRASSLDGGLPRIEDVCAHLADPAAYGRAGRAIGVPDWVRSELDDYQARIDHLAELRTATTMRAFTLAEGDIHGHDPTTALPALAPVLAICQQYADPESVAVVEDGGLHGRRHALAMEDSFQAETVRYNLRSHGYEVPDYTPSTVYVTGWNRERLTDRRDALLAVADELESQLRTVATNALDHYRELRDDGVDRDEATRTAISSAQESHERWHGLEYRWWDSNVGRGHLELDIDLAGTDPRVRDLLTTIDEIQHGLDAISVRAAYIQTAESAVGEFGYSTDDSASATLQRSLDGAAGQAARATRERALPKHECDRPIRAPVDACDSREPDTERGTVPPERVSNAEQSTAAPTPTHSSVPPGLIGEASRADSRDALVAMTEPIEGPALNAEWTTANGSDPAVDTSGAGYDASPGP